MFKRFIKLHFGLIKYLKLELPKKQNPKEIVLFLKQVLVVYIKELIKLYKDLFLIFDKTYRKQKKEYDKMQSVKKDLQRCIKMLQYIDQKMLKAGKSRQERRGFWREFYKNQQVRSDVFNGLDKEIG